MQQNNVRVSVLLADGVWDPWLCMPNHANGLQHRSFNVDDKNCGCSDRCHTGVHGWQRQ